MRHVRHVFQYLLLVGLPFAGLLGVLHTGRGLAAPMAVHGPFHLETIDAGAGTCLRTVLADSTLAITQSGERIGLSIGSHGLGLAGRLDGRRLSAAGELPATAGCPARARIRLEAQATRDAGRLSLAGTLQTGCAGCDSATFDAVQPRRPAAGR
ncbi:MAG TPA: hypothetical protein VFH97_00235 [Gemmatimonadales bacterium]|nr:hypothetical protein [Gemmatimonadales bacterium]